MPVGRMDAGDGCLGIENQWFSFANRRHGSGRKSRTALWLYRDSEVSGPAVVKHHAHRCAGQMLPSLMIRIVIRTGDKLE